jgi:hypothetical protein
MLSGCGLLFRLAISFSFCFGDCGAECVARAEGPPVRELVTFNVRKRLLARVKQRWRGGQ